MCKQPVAWFCCVNGSLSLSLSKVTVSEMLFRLKCLGKEICLAFAEDHTTDLHLSEGRLKLTNRQMKIDNLVFPRTFDISSLRRVSGGRGFAQC